MDPIEQFLLPESAFRGILEIEFHLEHIILAAFLRVLTDLKALVDAFS